MEHTLQEQLIVVLFVVTGLLIAPLIFIALDYWAGIRKARQRGEKIVSDKMKRTINKVSKYYNAILAMLVLDCVQIAGFVFLHTFNDWSAITFPFFTMIAVFFVAAIEIKSIVEPADAKESRQMKEVTELATAIAAHRTDPKEIAQAISEYLEVKKSEQ